MKIEELGIEVEDIEDYEGNAEEILTDYCQELEKQDGMIAKENDYPDDCMFMWSSKASTLISNELDKLYSIGRKYFGEDVDLEITSYMYKEI